MGADVVMESMSRVTKMMSVNERFNANLPQRYTGTSEKTREKKTRRNGYSRSVWGFCARSRNARRDCLSFCWQKR
jgi:hypothetical protein